MIGNIIHPNVIVGNSVRDTSIGKNVAVLGGGMTAAQLAVGALKKGAHHVTLISRRYTPTFHTHSRRANLTAIHWLYLSGISVEFDRLT